MHIASPSPLSTLYSYRHSNTNSADVDIRCRGISSNEGKSANQSVS
jgi:hypothetical protein